jgi:uncharacterized phage infection (PIP) family protein YhgE
MNRENLEQRLDLSQKIHFQLNEFNKQYSFYEQWLENIQRTNESISDQTLTIDEKLQRYHDVQVELDKRKQIINTLTHDYPQIAQQISVLIQHLLGNIERIKTNVTRKQEVKYKKQEFLFFISNILSKEHENQNRQQKDYRNRIESLLEWLKQTHRYEPLSDKRDLDSLQREHTRLIERRQHIDEKGHDIDTLLRTINRLEKRNFIF